MFVLKLRVMRSKVEEARSSMQAAKSKGKVIDALMQMKKNGQLPGVYGRLVIHNTLLIFNDCYMYLVFLIL